MLFSPSQWNKVCFECQGTIFSGEFFYFFTNVFGQAGGGWPDIHFWNAISVGWLVGQSHFQISTLSVSLDRYRASVNGKPWDVIYFLKAMTSSFQISIFQTVFFKVYPGICIFQALQQMTTFDSNEKYVWLMHFDCYDLYLNRFLSGCEEIEFCVRGQFPDFNLCHNYN